MSVNTLDNESTRYHVQKGNIVPKKNKDIRRFLNVLFKVMNDQTSVRMIPMVEPSAGAREKTTMEMQYIKSDT